MGVSGRLRCEEVGLVINRKATPVSSWGKGRSQNPQMNVRDASSHVFLLVT